MPHISHRFMVLLLPALLASLFSTAQLKGRVVAIADGDTFTLLTDSSTQVKVRLHGIDCPEKKQPYYQRAKDFTSALVFGKPVSLRVMGRDRYKRVIAIATTDRGVNLNEALLLKGLAWHFTRYDTNPRWASLQQQAIRSRAGLWADPAPIAPWDWRKI